MPRFPLILSPQDATLADATREGAVLFGLDDRAQVAVTGRDRGRFLHAMLTHEVKTVTPGSWRHASLCSAQGKLLLDVVLRVEADRVVMDVAHDRAEALTSGLARYVVADDVTFSTIEDRLIVAVLGPRAGEVLMRAGVLAQVPEGRQIVPLGGAYEGQGGAWLCERAGLPEIDLDVPQDALETLVPALVEAGATIGCHAAFEALRIEGAMPRWGVDVDDAVTPLEAGLEDTVSYVKGCYIGQEAIAMMTYRGHLRRHLARVEVQGEAMPLPGWLLTTAEGRRAGRVGSSVVWPEGRKMALAIVNRDSIEPGVELVAKAPEGAEGETRVVVVDQPVRRGDGLGE